MNEYYYDLESRDLEIYYNGLELGKDGTTAEHIEEVEKEIERREELK